MAMRLGIVSTADINRKVIPGAHASEKVEPSPSRAATRRAPTSTRGGGAFRAYGSYEAMLDDPEVDAVYISLPNTMHREWSIRSVEARKHVICEKPFSKRPDDVEAAFDAADRADRLLTEAFVYRHNPQTAKLVELVQDGAIGELRVVRSAFSYSLYDTENIRLRTDVDGGASWTSAATASAGRGSSPVSRRRSTARRHRPERDGLGIHRSHALLRRRPRVVRLRDLLPGRDELEAIGTEGSLFLDDPWHCNEPVIELRRDDGVEKIRLDPHRFLPTRAREPRRRDRGTPPLLLGREDALGQARTIEALFRSAETGTPTRL